ncbi:hypothetical protein E2C01_035206 [Portunus trituberculatus]|uniref:Uncharacterized protein n=1 Tax=Portunus trituberculatus TaxID=210409 RepID=A0A5B7F7Q5_PORTR|nr:hypothetical protein [Portunus trituberculatus]
MYVRSLQQPRDPAPSTTCQFQRSNECLKPPPLRLFVAQTSKGNRPPDFSWLRIQLYVKHYK